MTPKPHKTKTQKFFSSKEVLQITDVKRTRLHQWQEYGWLKPSGEVAYGHGTRNLYTRQDLYNIRLFREITERGLHRKVVGSFLSHVDDYPIKDNQDWGSIDLWLFARVEDEIIPICVEHDRIDEPLFSFVCKDLNKPVKYFDDIYIINFSKIREEVDSKIKELE